MSGKKSRDKGKRGEREAAGVWRDIGFTCAHRTAQHKGGGVDSADLSGTGIYFVEVCVGKQLPDIYKKVSQAVADCESESKMTDSRPRIPVVQVKKDGKEWLFVMTQEAFYRTLWRM